MIVKIDNDNEFFSKYELYNKNDEDTNNLPHSTYREKFKNFRTNYVRKNEINLYMNSIKEIIKLAEDKGLQFTKRYSMDDINHFNQYLYCFIKK